MSRITLTFLAAVVLGAAWGLLIYLSDLPGEVAIVGAGLIGLTLGLVCFIPKPPRRKRKLLVRPITARPSDSK
jgi:hypothetical protein